MTLLFTKNETVKVTSSEFRSLLQELVKTMKRHIEFTTGDNDTVVSWNQLLNDGIDQPDLMTVEDVGNMVGLTEQEDKVIGSILPTLFDRVPALKHYWNIEKTNSKSIYIRRLAHKSDKQLLSKMEKQSTEKSSAPMRQTTLLPTSTDVDTNVSTDKNITEAKDNNHVHDDVFVFPKKTGLARIQIC